jgi:hypothetical protein
LVAFEAALMKSQASWSESAKSLANQSLNAALGTTREKIAAFSEEAGRKGSGRGARGDGKRPGSSGKGRREAGSNKLGKFRRCGDRVSDRPGPYCFAIFSLSAAQRCSCRSFQSEPSIFW